MTVTPYGKTRFQNRKDLYHFFSICHQKSIQNQQPQILSISIELGRFEAIDPLAFLQAFLADWPTLISPWQATSSYHSPYHFYFERDDRSLTASPDPVAIAAVGATAQCLLNAPSPDRFVQAKQFIEATLARSLIIGDDHSEFSGPHFLGGFTFFDQPDPESEFAPVTLFLPTWQVARSGSRTTVVANIAIQPSTEIATSVDQFWQSLTRIRSLSKPWQGPVRERSSHLHLQDVTPIHQFKQGVVSALQAIQAGEVHKVVLARAVDVRSPHPFELVPSLHQLRTRYPGCCVFSLSNGQGRNFIGASPERLVRLGDRILLTDALAGSAPRGTTNCEDATLASHLLNSPKELFEHRVVVDFITQRLHQLGLTPQLSPLQLLQLSNIQHLHTPIQAIVPNEVHPLDIVAALHPTPAVAGLPSPIACAYIQQWEGLTRSLYASPIGWLDYRGNSEFVVGIRSAFIAGHQARLFAGAGIVAGSDPDRELAEVQLKLQALLAALV